MGVVEQKCVAEAFLPGPLLGQKSTSSMCRYTPLNKSGNLVVATAKAFIYAVLKGFQRRVLEEGLEPTPLTEPRPVSERNAFSLVESFGLTALKISFYEKVWPKTLRCWFDSCLNLTRSEHCVWNESGVFRPT